MSDDLQGRTWFAGASYEAASPLLLIPPQIFGFLVCMGVILAIGNAIWEHEVGMRFQVYLPWDEAVDSAFFSGFLSFWSYIIILNTVVPISLYVRYVALCAWGLSRELGLPRGQLLLSVKVTSSRRNVASPSRAVNMLCCCFSLCAELTSPQLPGTLDCAE